MLGSSSLFAKFPLSFTLCEYNSVCAINAGVNVSLSFSKLVRFQVTGCHHLSAITGVSAQLTILVLPLCYLEVMKCGFFLFPLGNWS